MLLAIFFPREPVGCQVPYTHTQPRIMVKNSRVAVGRRRRREMREK